jgi:DNA-binding response OmpR family regulator
VTSPFQVLLVEDDARSAKLYAAAIEDGLPTTVRTTGSAEEAIAALAAMLQPPDLVVIDLELPGQHGDAVLAAVRSDARSRSVPVVVLTGLSDVDTQMRLLEAGADDFIEKGSPPEIVIARLGAQLRHKLAADRLERLALERDLFAAGVLADIGSVKWAILTSCRELRTALRDDPAARAADIKAQLDRLTAVASKLGAYAADVIQSVRDTTRAPATAPQDLAALLAAVADALATDAPQSAAKLLIDVPQPLTPVLGDKSFLRLALLNVARYLLAALPRTDGGLPELRITVTQELATSAPASPRATMVTRLSADAPDPTDAELARLFAGHRDARRTDDDGLNLGLALVAKVIAKMGGRAWAERAPTGKGVSICLELARS